MKRSSVRSVQAGPPSWRTEVQAGPRKKHTIVAAWLPDAAQDHLTCANGQQKFGSRERNEYLSLPMHGETVGGHTIKHSINLTFHLSNSPPALPGGLHQTARRPGWHPLALTAWHPLVGPKGPRPQCGPPRGKRPSGLYFAACVRILQTHNRRA